MVVGRALRRNRWADDLAGDANSGSAGVDATGHSGTVTGGLFPGAFLL